MAREDGMHDNANSSPQAEMGVAGVTGVLGCYERRVHRTDYKVLSYSTIQEVIAPEGDYKRGAGLC